MSLTQELLHDHLAHRITRARPDLARAHDLSTPDGLLAVQALASDDDGVAVIAVLRRFDLAAWVRGTVALASGLDAESASAWRGAFTRTLFLAGNPANLGDRFAFARTDPAGSAAWTAPAPATAHTPLRRLLRAFAGTRELAGAADVPVPLPGPPTGRRVLCLVRSGLALERGLVHLGHLLAEAVLDGLLRPGDLLVVRGVPRLVGAPGPFDALRVDSDPDCPGRLLAVTGLVEEDAGV
ncbi:MULTISPECIES: DUF6182 family protein [Actinosynnema]|uniref:DUF6182 family protein n=1 Tax=Actinosynnema TaxID=40566 RepID=UPI0020A3E8D1|nr:DUF6182 family protein [Actinosynnema pretiosum]MCP2094780.1 hypothetical protein [Actinosynnema pretiosum]